MREKATLLPVRILDEPCAKSSLNPIGTVVYHIIHKQQRRKVYEKLRSWTLKAPIIQNHRSVRALAWTESHFPANQGFEWHKQTGTETTK